MDTPVQHCSPLEVKLEVKSRVWWSSIKIEQPKKCLKKPKQKRLKVLGRCKRRHKICHHQLLLG